MKKIAKENSIKTFKALDKDFSCRGFQFQIGNHYHEDNVEVCSSGFHSCENPFDILNYYDLTECRFAMCESWGDIDSHEDDSKIACSDISILRELSLAEFISAVHDFIYNESSTAASGHDSQLATSGDSSKLAASGDSSKLAASGNYSQLAASGKGSQLAASGDSSKLAASGDSSKLAASGNYSKLAASGNGSQLAASGKGSQLAASGHYSQLAASGDSSKLAASGIYSQLAASGIYSQLAASGNYSQLAASGNYSQLAASGDSSKLAASGKGSQLAASGKGSQLEITGENSVGAHIGAGGLIKGIKGSWITIAEYDDNLNCILVKSAKIDGVKLKENTWYTLKNKKFTKVK